MDDGACATVISGARMTTSRRILVTMTTDSSNTVVTLISRADQWAGIYWLLLETKATETVRN